MRLLLKVIGGIAFVVVNCYGLKWAFAAMSYKSDLAFFLGMIGLALLIAVDGLILIRVFNAVLPKGEMQ